MTTKQKLHFSIDINAPKQKVWDTMLQDATYREWTKVFNDKGSWFEGDWREGSKILFVGPDQNGKTSGMVSRINVHRPYEYVSIEHLGFIHDGKEDTTSAAVKQWVPAFENYAIKESNGVTRVDVDMDTTEEYRQMFDEKWPQALQRLKEIAER
jgi:uncharacterized protein YndB with AHSA1/START domain